MAANSAKDDVIDFIPEIECGSAVNGIITLSITNIDSFWVINDSFNWEDIAFQVSYRTVPSKPSNPRHSGIDSIWREKYILYANTPDDGKLHFKVSVYLNDYNLEFRLKAKNNKKNMFMTESKMYIINIASFLKDSDFKIGEKISYRDDESSYTSNGTITEKLKENMYRVRYFKFDKEKQEFMEGTHDIDISRLYHMSTDKIFELNLRNNESLNKNLLIKRDDIESINIFNAIKDSLEDISIDFCIELYGVATATMHWEAMNDFMSKHIFECLYGAQFNYTVDCLLNGMIHKGLEMMNIRQHDIKIKYEAIQKDETSEYQNIDIVWSCDWCRCEMSEWEFGFKCIHSKFENRHEFCINCINSIIVLNDELIDLLKGLLSNQLINDCIQLIVDFVIGRVVVNDTYCCSKKRDLDDFNIPNPKRRKLN